MAKKQNIRVCDEVVDLLDGYEALERLAFVVDGPSSPVVALLDNLNRQLRRSVDRMDKRGLVT